MIVIIEFMGFEFCCDVDYKMTSRGTLPVYSRDPAMYDPGAPPEWETKSIKLYRYDTTFDPETKAITLVSHPIFEATGALFSVLSDLDAVTEAIEMEIIEGADDEGDYFF